MLLLFLLLEQQYLRESVWELHPLRKSLDLRTLGLLQVEGMLLVVQFVKEVG